MEGEPQDATPAEPAAVAEPSTGEAGAPSEEWDGSPLTVEKVKWWSDIPEPVRPKLVGGLKAREAAHTKGVQGKITESNARVKGLEEELATLKRQAALYDSVLGGNEDPRVAETRAELEAARAEAAALKAERDGLTAKVGEFTKAEEKRAKEAAEKEAGSLLSRLGPIAKDDGAFKLFHALYVQGFDEAEAVEAVHARFPGLKAARPGKDIELMSPGDGPHGGELDHEPGTGLDMDTLLKIANRAEARLSARR